MLLLIALAASASPPPPPVRVQEARATARIERSQRVTQETWTSAAEDQRREIIRRDEKGRLILLRLIENQ